MTRWDGGFAPSAFAYSAPQAFCAFVSPAALTPQRLHPWGMVAAGLQIQTRKLRCGAHSIGLNRLFAGVPQIAPAPDGRFYGGYPPEKALVKHC